MFGFAIEDSSLRFLGWKVSWDLWHSGFCSRPLAILPDGDQQVQAHEACSQDLGKAEEPGTAADFVARFAGYKGGKWYRQVGCISRIRIQETLGCTSAKTGCTSTTQAISRPPKSERFAQMENAVTL